MANRNYRRYFTGQAVSLVGTWMQTVAQSWLVLQLTGSGTALGLVVALQTLPVLLLGPYGGVVADRVDKRKLMIALQSMMGVLALVLGVLTVTHVVTLWEVYVLAFLLGLNNTFENPARQAFVLEMVGPADLRNAVSLNSVLVNAARAVGPAVAGMIIALGGTGICFLLNAVSFVAVVASLMRLDVSKLTPTPPRAGRRARCARDWLRPAHAGARRPAVDDGAGRLPGLRVPGRAAGGRGPDLPRRFGHLRVHDRRDGRRRGHRRAVRRRPRARPGCARSPNASAMFGVVIALAAAAPELWVELVALALVGGASVGFLSKGNSTLQLTAAPQMRGRVMALWAVAFLGSTPIGGPIAGWVADTFGGRAGLVLGAVACLVAAGLGALVLARSKRRAEAATDSQVLDDATLAAAD